MIDVLRVSVVNQYTGPRTFVSRPVAQCCRCCSPIYNVLEWIAQSIPENWLCHNCSKAPEGQVKRVKTALSEAA